jgi:hypothetical protein
MDTQSAFWNAVDECGLWAAMDVPGPEENRIAFERGGSVIPLQHLLHSQRARDYAATELTKPEVIPAGGRDAPL